MTSNFTCSLLFPVFLTFGGFVCAMHHFSTEMAKTKLLCVIALNVYIKIFCCSEHVCMKRKERHQIFRHKANRERKKKHWNFFSDLQGFTAIIVKCYQMSYGGGYLILELCFPSSFLRLKKQKHHTTTWQWAMIYGVIRKIQLNQ